MIYVGVFFLGVVFGIVLMCVVSGGRKPEEEPKFEPICIRQESYRIETIKALQIIDKEDPYHNSDFKNEIKQRLLSELIECADKAGAVTYIATPFHENHTVRIEAQLSVGVKR